MRRGHPARRYRETPRKSGAPAKVGLTWSAKDGRVERGGLAPPNKACWNSSKGGGLQPRYAFCTTMHHRGCFEPHTDLQRVWRNGQIRLRFKNRQLPDMTFVRE